MSIFDNIKNFFSGSSVHGGFPAGLNLSRDGMRRLRRQVVELQRQTDALTRRDIGDWRQAWQLAINVERPDRRTLYDIYRDVEIDLHLSGCVKQREGFVLSRSFKIMDENDNENEDAQLFFNTAWFKQLMKYALDSNYWGHSLIELGNVITFAEIFGMPMRIAHTTLRDEKELKKMEKMMADMGTEGWGLFQEGTDIEVVESTKGDAFNVYDKRIDRANSELSKLVIGQTMTIEDGSSLSQSETHLKVFENLVEADCDMIRDVVNNQLIPKMVAHGFPLQGLHFDWDYSIDYTPEQQAAYEQMILNNYEVEPKYFEEKYGMPVGERRQQPALGGFPADEATVPDGSPSGKKNLMRPFFD